MHPNLTVVRANLEIPIGGSRTTAERIAAGRYFSVDYRLVAGVLTIPRSEPRIAHPTLITCTQEMAATAAISALEQEHFQASSYDTLLSVGEHWSELHLDDLGGPIAVLCDLWTDPKTGVTYAPYLDRAYSGALEQALRLQHIGFPWWPGTLFLVEPRA